MPINNLKTPGPRSRGEKTRADIIACAQALFYERGYAGTSFSDIVAATDVYRGNIYHYFKSKDEILQAVIDGRLGEYRALLEAWERQSSEPKARLNRFVNMIAERKNEVIRHGCPIGSLNTELAKNQRELQQLSKALFDLFCDWLALQFTALGHAKNARPLALHLMGRAQGISVIAHVYGDAKLLQREVAALAAWLDELSAA